jgi:hypothetical protein
MTIVCNFLRCRKEPLAWDRRGRNGKDIKGDASKGGIEFVIFLSVDAVRLEKQLK